MVWRAIWLIIVLLAAVFGGAVLRPEAYNSAMLGLIAVTVALAYYDMPLQPTVFQKKTSSNERPEPMGR